MWEPLRLTILWAFTACYRDSLTCTILTTWNSIRSWLDMANIHMNVVMKPIKHFIVRGNRIPCYSWLHTLRFSRRTPLFRYFTAHNMTGKWATAWHIWWLPSHWALKLLITSQIGILEVRRFDSTYFSTSLLYLHLWTPFRQSRVRIERSMHYATSRKVANSIPDVIGFFNWPNPSSRTMALASTQPLTEMSTRNLPGGKGLPARNADNLTAICEPIV
jgi:hypothetical protein